MPTDRSLNRAKKISRSRFGQQTLHKPKKTLTLALQQKQEITEKPTQRRPPQSGGTLAPSVGRDRFKVGSGINGILPARQPPGGPLPFIPFLA